MTMSTRYHRLKPINAHRRVLQKTPSLLFCSLLLISSSRLLAENAIEEVIVEADNDITAPTEMDADTERLFSVAGAASDPLQAIYALPGVTFSNSDGPGGSDPVIRGSSPQDNAYFIDMVPAAYIFHIFGNSIFNKDLIRSFELHPAAFSSEFGNATGGIIDVSLREPRNQDFTTTLHTSFLSAGVMVESGIGEDQAFYASYRRSMMDRFVDEDDVADDEPGLTVDSMPVSDDYQLKYSWNLNEEHNLTLVAAGASDSLGATFGSGSNEVERDPDFAGPAAIDQRFDSQGLVWDWNQEDRRLRTVLTHIADSEKFTYGNDQREKTDATRLLARVRYEQSLNDQHAIRTGVSFEDITYDLDFNAKIVACSDLDPDCSTVDADFVVYDETLKIKAYDFFIEDKWLINDKHSLTFGVNYTDDDYMKEGRVEPRLRWEYLINDTVSTYAAAGQYSQLPNLREMIDVLGNPDLKKIKADHYVWGLKHELSEGWSWQTDVYYKKMTDVVISSEADSSAENYSNNAEGTAYGVEFLVNKALTDRWYGWVSLSLSETDRTNTVTDETVKFEYDKPVLLNVVLNRLVGERWMMGVKWTFQSGGRYTPVTHLVASATEPGVMEPVYGELNSEQYPDFHRLDFRAEYTSPKDWGYWKFYVDILNVYGRENVEEYDYAPNGKDLISPPKGFGKDVPVSEEVGDGMFPSIGFEVQF